MLKNLVEKEEEFNSKQKQQIAEIKASLNVLHDRVSKFYAFKWTNLNQKFKFSDNKTPSDFCNL